ncbi:MAG: hypothetical protein HGA86_05400, partial [Anaerolineaceae bacterium]|nr:hypothetical protein [Anaerolineaceae bacterium]
MSMYSQALLDFFKPLLDLPALLEGEAPQSFAIQQDFPARQIKLLHLDDYDRLRAEFGSALTLIIGQAASPLLHIKAGQYKGNPVSGLAFIAGLPDDSLLPLKLTIDKTVLISARKVDTYTNAFLYFFRQRFSAFLKRPLQELDADLFKESGATLVLVSGFEGSLNGPFLTIVNEENCPRPPAPPPVLDEKTLASLKEYRQIPLDRVNWSGFELGNLTPLHLLTEARGKDGHAAAAILNGRLLHLLVLYSANRTLRGKDGTFHATYASSDHTAEVSFADEYAIVKKPAPLAGLVRWLSEE